MRIFCFGDSSRYVGRGFKHWVLSRCGSIFLISLLPICSAYGQSGPLSVDILSEARRGSGALTECPDFSPYYQKSNAFKSGSAGVVELWASLAAELMALMPICLTSSEYFALLGAAQLNSFQNPRAIESLERALLLQPENGAAKIDYAQALYNSGQLFPALEINETLLGGEALPAGLLEGLEVRDRLWRSDTRENSFYMDIAAGYDSNLNGAPDLREVNLTLSGEEVALSLNRAFQSTSGPYSNLRVANRLRMLAPDAQHSWSNEVRARQSADQDSDLLRFDSRYSFLKSARARRWQIDGSLTHLLFGGSSLFSAANLSGRYQFNSGGACSPAAELAAQRQYFREQRTLNGVEGRLGGRLQCELAHPSGVFSNLSFEFGLLRNFALQPARPGGNREGWQASAQWQSGNLVAQVSQTQLDDRLGYSPVLANGAKRRIKREQLLLQYRRPLQISDTNVTWFVSFFHQNQESNISFFAARDTSIETGLSFVF